MRSIDLVIKIGSMALIQRDDGAIDYNIFQRLGDDLHPGMALVTSGATEIGRLDISTAPGASWLATLSRIRRITRRRGKLC